MKKNVIFSIFCCLALATVFCSCGGEKKPTSEMQSIIERSKKGIFGEVGAEFVKNEAMLRAMEQDIEDFQKKEAERLEKKYPGQTVGSSEAYREELMKVMSEIEERRNKLAEARSAWVVRAKELSGEITKIELKTEVADSVPLKVVEPFRVVSIGVVGNGNSAQLKGKVAMTAERPKIFDWNRKPDGYYKVKLAIIGPDGVATDTMKLSCDFNGTTGILAVGDEAEVTFHFPVSEICESGHVASRIVTAKALRIIWPHFAQEKVGDTVHGDLGIFGLRGPVKECKWKTLWDTWTLYFNDRGQWVREKGRGTFNEFPKQQRDAQGRLTKMSDNYDEQRMTFEYNAQGLNIRETTEYMDGGGATTFEWDAEGFCTKEKNSSGGVDGPEESVNIYTVLERDHHNNWTSRKNQNGKVETRTISYYDE